MIAWAVIRTGRGVPAPQCVGVFPQTYRAHDRSCRYEAVRTDISGGAFERICNRAMNEKMNHGDPRWRVEVGNAQVYDAD